MALKCAEMLSESDIMVVIIPDSGTRYLSKIYNDNWMRDNQFLEPRITVRAGQVVRDKMRRTGQIISVPLGITVEDAVNLMREHAISQIPVIESGDVVGSLSEARILEILVQNPEAKRRPVAEYMEGPFPVISEDASLTEVTNAIGQNTTAILVKQANGFDIITKSDLIYFLTRQNGDSRH